MAGRKKEQLMPTSPQCPYFRWADDRQIQCKGGSIPGADDIHRFSSAEEYNWQYRNLCCFAYTQCPCYRTIKHWNWEDQE